MLINYYKNGLFNLCMFGELAYSLLYDAFSTFFKFVLVPALRTHTLIRRANGRAS